MAIFPNWQAITALVNPHLKMLAATADDETRAKLAAGFPELFQDEKPENNGPWPLSVLRRVAADKLATSDPDVFEGLIEFGLPYIKVGGSNCTDFEKDDQSWLKLTPEEAQAIFKKIRRDRLFPFDLDRVAFAGADYYIGLADDDTHNNGPDAHTHGWAYLFPAALVFEDK